MDWLVNAVSYRTLVLVQATSALSTGAALFEESAQTSGFTCLTRWKLMAYLTHLRRCQSDAVLFYAPCADESQLKHFVHVSPGCYPIIFCFLFLHIIYFSECACQGF